ncbi:hypothetical protein L2E82_29970 [Cichorium intybus]|uniref:Uncharacterized protein n=1 Tax=Cichorium intybus TaxID=13427 RepID=A0ACB9CZ78_CICIN|nr:hypothetical protein L2E82_29970 [Cichorium intybus]
MCRQQQYHSVVAEFGLEIESDDEDELESDEINDLDKSDFKQNEGEGVADGIERMYRTRSVLDFNESNGIGTGLSRKGLLEARGDFY